MNILIRSNPKNLEHKMEDQFKDPGEHLCYWTFGITPRGKNLKKILFTNGKNVFAEGEIIAIEDKAIVFKPLKRVEYRQPRSPPTKGFAYVL